jgi:hypothetical protein
VLINIRRVYYNVFRQREIYEIILKNTKKLVFKNIIFIYIILLKSFYNNYRIIYITINYKKKRKVEFRDIYNSYRSPIKEV